MARRRRKKLPTEPVEARIESLDHEGRGVTHIDGKTVFVHGALAGERVEFQYMARHRRFDEGRVVAVHEASDERVEPKCEHFGVCGGCALQHMDHEAQLRNKQDVLLEHLRHIGKIEPGEILEPLRGPLWGYRRKARLGVRNVRKKGRVLVGFRERYSAWVADMRRCEILHPSVGLLLEELSDLIGTMSARDKIAQIEVAVDDSHTALVFRNLVELDDEDTAALVEFARAREPWVYLQPAGPDSVSHLWPESGELSYALPEHGVELFFRPTDFTQVNTDINRLMVDRALGLLDPGAGDTVADLFCGLGNFSLPLARRAARVIAVEGDAALVERARSNAERNGLDNLEFLLGDLFEGIPDAVIDTHPNKLLLDPPRSGALEAVSMMDRLAPERIVYVSCNTATLARDAGVLVNEQGYRLLSAGIMDMFPHTAHVESIALFERRPSG